MSTFKHPSSAARSDRSSPDIALVDARPSKRLRTGHKTTRSASPSDGEDVDMDGGAEETNGKHRGGVNAEADADASSEDEGPLRQTTQGGRTLAGGSGTATGGKTSRKGLSSKRPNKGPGGGAGAGKGAGKTSSKGLASAPTREPIQIVNRDGEDVVVDELGNVIRSLDDEDEADGAAAKDETSVPQAPPPPPQASDEAIDARKQARDAEAALIDKLATGVSVDADMDSVAGLTHVQMDEVDIDEDWGDVLQFVGIACNLILVDCLHLLHRRNSPCDLPRSSSERTTYACPLSRRANPRHRARSSSLVSKISFSGNFPRCRASISPG